MKTTFIPFILLVFIFTCCSESNKDQSTEAAAEVVETPEIRKAFSLWENIAVRDAPAATGKYLTALSVGEEVEFMDSTVTEETDKKYSYTLVKLSDGKEGWTRSDFIFPDVELVAVNVQTKIYSRPDLLTATNDSFEPLDLVVIKSMQNDWYEVTGVPRGGTWFKSGWIPAGNVHDDPTAVKVAALATKAMKQTDDARRREIFELIGSDEELGRYFSDEIEELMLTDKAFFMAEENYSVYECVIEDEINNPFTLDGPLLINDLTLGPSYNEMYSDAALKWAVTNCIGSFKGYPLNDYDYVEYEDQMAALKDMSGHQFILKTADDGADFDHVNPEFVYWASSNLVPNPEDKLFEVPFKDIYNVLIRDQARGWVKAYLVFRKYENAVSAYTEVYESGGHAGMYLMEAYENEQLNEEVDPFRVGFWIRRTIDGSAPAFESGLKKIMVNYDRAWYEGEMSAAESSFGQMSALVW